MHVITRGPKGVVWEVLRHPLSHATGLGGPLLLLCVCVCVSHSVVSNSLRPHGL